MVQTRSAAVASHLATHSRQSTATPVPTRIHTRSQGPVPVPVPTPTPTQTPEPAPKTNTARTKKKNSTSNKTGRGPKAKATQPHSTAQKKQPRSKAKKASSQTKAFRGQSRKKKTPPQEAALRAMYEANTHPSAEEMRTLAPTIGLTYTKVRDWFTNRRRTLKKCAQNRGETIDAPARRMRARKQESTPPIAGPSGLSALDALALVCSEATPMDMPAQASGS